MASHPSPVTRYPLKRHTKQSNISAKGGLFRPRRYTGHPAIVSVLFMILLLLAQTVAAQDPSTVTADDVNAVARDMYCPVCENIPLDVCPTVACQQWRDEIRTQLQEGQTPEQIKASFVARYGDRVVGTPEDPTLRALSLVTPWVVAVAALVVAVMTVVRWRRNRPGVRAAAAEAGESLTDDAYRARLERDLLARR